MQQQPPPPRHLSLFAGDPFMQPLLRDFVQRLPEQVRLIRVHRAEEGIAGLRNIIHQLKGSGRSFGYPHISAHARAAEEALTADHPLAAIDEHLTALVDYIEHIDGYEPGRGSRV